MARWWSSVAPLAASSSGSRKWESKLRWEAPAAAPAGAAPAAAAAAPAPAGAELAAAEMEFDFLGVTEGDEVVEDSFGGSGT